MTDDSRDPKDRRSRERYDVDMRVDCRSGDNFLYASIHNISELGIFVYSETPLTVGTRVGLSFEHDGTNLELAGEVSWVNPLRADGDNPNPGMGVRFIDLTPAEREVVVDLVRSVAYLDS